MTAARSLILGRIRDAVGAARRAGCRGLRTHRADLHQRRALSREALPRAVRRRLKHYQVAVHLCARGEVAATVAATMASRAASPAWSFRPTSTARWLSPDAAFVRDEGLAYRELDESEGVLTGCSLGIATTGTIVLRHGRGEGRRALTPDPRLPPLRRAGRADRRDGSRGHPRARGCQVRAGHDDLRAFGHRRHRDDAHPRRARPANAGRHRRRRADRALTRGYAARHTSTVRCDIPGWFRQLDDRTRAADRTADPAVINLAGPWR